MRSTNISLYEGIKYQADRIPGNTALYYKGLEISYAKLLNNINRIAGYLTDMGIAAKDVVTLCLPNFPTAVYLLYAVNQNGSIANMVHPLVSHTQMKGILEETGSKYLFCLDTKYNDFKTLEEDGVTVVPCNPVDELPRLIRIVYSQQKRNELKLAKRAKIKSANLLKHAPKKEFVHLNKEDQVYLHSGGTTSKSKTIALSSFAINSLANQSEYILGTKDVSNKFMYGLLPMFHGFGFCMGIHSCLFMGAADNLMPKFNVKETVKYIKKNKLHYLIGIPPIYEALLANKDFHGDILKNLYVAYIGADFVSVDLMNRFNKRMEEAGSKCRIFEGYGLTETVTVITVNSFKFNKMGSVGKPLPTTKIRIRNLENTEDKPAGIPGEVYCAGTTLMNGYRFGPNEAFWKDPKTEEIWIKTGDMGYLDAEGFLHFKQRIKRIIKVSGIEVLPTEIEQCVTGLPFVKECVAKGIPDEKRGTMIKLFVVLNKTKGKVPTDFKKVITNAIKEECGVYAQPKTIVCMEKFPRTIVGKIDSKNMN